MKKAVMQASICGLIASTHLFSNPTGPLITSGDVSVDFVDAHHLHVDSRSERSIITWDSFSIDAAESAYFHLPDSSSAVLNKVSSNLPSTLAGLLESNGHVYLLNPNGVLVTKEGVINTASFLASTLDVNNDFFLRGEDLLFAGTSQESVINQGKITSWQGDVVLLGLVVRNEGEINAVNGVAALGAGTEILLTPHADYRIAIQVPVADLGHGDVGIAQEGIITALQTELKTSGNAYALAIHNSGRINATSFEKTAGRVYLIADKGLVSHTGTITAIGTDTVGGDVQILGERVALTEGAIVDVSGDFGGGSLLVGGDYRGANPAINNAMHTFVEDGVTLTADALQSGNGGQVIVWGVESARFFGFASAQGGPFTGSGGFIEVSSVNSLQYNGLANTLAKNGSSGTLLLDPTDVDIITAGAGLVLNGVSCFADTYCGGCTGLAAAGIDPVVILAQLLLTDVIIDASSGAGAGAGSITITTGFDTTGTANDLTLIALTDVDINDDVTIGGTGNFFIYAGSNNDGTQIGTGGIANLGTIGGVITLAAGTTLETTSSGNITLVTSFTSNLDGIVIDGTLNSSGSGGVFMQTYFGGNIHFSATGLLTSSGSSQFSFSSINDILFDGAAPITFSAGSGTLQLVAGDSAQCGTGVIDIAGTVLFDTGTTGGLSFNSNAGVTLNTVNYDSTAASTIFSSFSVDLNGPVNVGTTTVNEFLVQSGVVITVNDAISVNTTAPVIGAGNYTLRLLSSQVITVDADVNVVDEASLRLTAQVISFNGAHTSTFNTNGAVDIFSASGSATTNIGDGVNAYNFVHQSLGTVTFNGSNVLMNSPSTITANILGSQLQFTTRLSALSGTTITFDPGCDGINMTKGCSLSGVFDYHTAGAFTATTTANPLATGTTGVLTFDGAGTVSFIATGGSIQFNNQGVNSFAVSNSTTLVVTQTTGSILMGTMARIDYTSSPNLSILTTTGSIDFDGTSLINFNPSMAGAFLSITSTDGNVNVGSITYGAGTGTCTISSTNGSVGQNSGGLLDWSSATAGGLVFSGGSGVSINGDINYTTTNPFSMTTTVAGVIFQDSASTITVNAGASGLALNATNTAGSNAIDIAGDINYSSANDFDFNVASGNVALESTANLSMLAGSGSLNIGTTGTPLPGTIISTGLITYSSGAVGESLSMVAVEQITAGNISITDGSTNLIRSTTNDIITDALTTISASSGNLTMDAPLGQITTNGALTFSGGTLTLTCQDDININNTTMITGASELIATTSAGDLYLNSVLTVNSSLAVGTQLTAALGGIGINGAGVTFTGGAFVLSCQNDIDINSTSSFTGNSRFSMTSTTANVSLNNSLSVDSTNATASQFISTLGNVNINNSITYSGALNVNPLTITAQNDIGMNNTFSYLSSGDCTLTATTGILGFNVVTFPAGGTGGLTGSADLAVFINGPMVFDSSGNYSLTAITGPLLINATFDLATTGQLDLHAGQDLFIINALTNTLAGDMFFSGGTIFRIEPVLFGVQGSISSAGGDITIGGIAGTTGMVRLQGSSNPGFINSNGGAISITSTGDAFLIDNVSIDSGAGSYNLSIGGALNLLAAANTIITGTSGVVAVTDNLLILADSGGSSQITAAGNVTITSGDSIYLIGFPATAQTASINSSAAGNVSVSTTGGAGTLEIRDSSNITTTGVGTITLAAVGHVIIDNDSRVQTTGTGLITIGTVGTRIGGNITVSGGITGPSSITATTGGISIFTTNSILMGGVSAVNRATITASGGIYTLNAGKSIIMNPFATASLTAGAGALTLAAAQEIIMAGNTLLTNSGTGTSTITMADGTFMSGLEGVTTITTGTGALSMTASNKIFMSSMESNIFTVTTGGNATLTSTRNIIALVGAPSAVTEIITTGVLSLSASQNIDILNNVSLSSTGNMNLTTTNGDLAIQNIASISAGALFTGTIGGDVAMKSSEVGGATSLTGGTGVTFNVTNDFYVAGAGGAMSMTATTGDLNIATARNCFLTGSTVVRPNLLALAGDVIFNVTEQMIVDYSVIAASAPAGNVTITVINDNLSLINGAEINTFGTGTTTCTALNASIYMEGGPTLRTVISGGSGGVSLMADRMVMDAQGAGVGNTAQVSTTGPLTIIVNTVFAMDKTSTVTASGAGALGITVTTGDFICNRNSTISQTGSGTLTIAAPLGNAIISGGNGNTSITTTTGTLTIAASKIDMISGLIPGSARVTSTGNIIFNGSDQITLSGAVNSTTLVSTTLGSVTINASRNLNILDNSSVTITGIANANALNLNVTGDLIVSNLGTVTHSGTGVITATPNIGGNIVVKGGPLGNSVINAAGGTLFLTALGNINLEAVSTGTAEITSLDSLTLTSDNMYANGYLLLATSKIAQISSTNGPLTLNANNDLILQNNAQVFVTMGALALQADATAGNLVVSNGSFIEHQGTGSVSSTVGANAHIFGGVLGDGIISSNAALTFAVTGLLDIQAGSGFEGRVLSNGLTSITAGSINMRGDSVLVRALLEDSSGDLTVNAGLTTLNAHTTLSLTGGAGNMLVTLTDDLIVANDSIIQNSSTGTMTISTTGTATLLAGAGDAIVQGSTNTSSLTADNNIFVLSDLTGAAEITSAGDLVVTATNGNIYIIGSPQGLNASTINSTGGALTVLADHNVILNDDANIEITAGTADISVTATNGDLIIQNDSFVQNLGTGSVLITVGENILISGGVDGDSFIVDTGPIMLTVPGSLEVEALSGFSGYISSDGNTTIAAGRVSIMGFSMAVPAYISDASGSLSISGSNVDLNNFAQIFLSSGAGTLTVDSTGDLRIANASFIQHQGTGLTTSTITDTLYIEGGPDGAASLLGGTGGVTVAANAILLNGFSSVNNAQISAVQGNLSVTSTLETSLNPHAQIMLAGGTGTYLVTVGDGLLVGSDSVLQNAGTGTTTVNVTGVTVFSAGSDSARLLGSTGALTLTSTDSLQISASEDAIASITSSGQITVSSLNDVTLVGSVVGPRTALIQTTTNTLSVTGGQNVALLNNARIVITGGAATLTVNATVGNLTLDNQASIQHTGTGTISASIGRDVVINGGLNGDSFIRANSAGLNFVFTGALAIQSLSSNNGFIQAAGLSSISASKISIIGFSAAIPAFIQNSSGNLTVSAGSIEMVDFAQIRITAGSGALAVNTTSGDLRIGNNSLIQNSGTGPTTSMVNRSLYVEGGPGGASSFLGGNGGLNIAAGSAIQMSGFSSAFDALISTVQGGLTISSGQETSLNPHSSITISNVGTASALQLTVGSDLLVMDNSTIRHFGTGSTTINVTGVANVLAGTGNATIRGGSGAMTITATDNINILSDVTGVASIQNTGNLSVSTTQDISIVGSPGGIQNAFIQTGAISNPTLSITSHYLTIRDGGDIAITTGSGTLSVTCTQLSIEDNAFLQQQGTGSFNGMISGDCILRGGPAGPATLLVHSPLTLMIGGDLKIEADANSLASISSQGATSISASRIYMIGFSDTFNAMISNTTGSLTVAAASMNLIDFGQIQLTGGAGTLTVNTTNGDLRIANGSFIRHQGTGGLASTINQTLYIEGGVGNKAFYTSGSGGINISANVLVMNGFSSGNNALISATTGNVALSTTTTMNLNPFATVSITGIAGSGILSVSAGTDLLVANGSTLLNLGLGATTVNVTGVATFLGGAGDSSLKGNTGALSLTVGDNLHIISDILGRAFIQNSGNITIMVGSDVHVIGSPEAALTSSIQTSNGTLSVTAANNIIVEDKSMIAITAGAGTLSVTTTSGDLFIENDSSIQQQGTGAITASVGGNAVIKSGSSGNGFISTNSTLNVTVSKDLLIEDVQGLQAFITSNGLTSISSNRLFMIGFDSTHQAYIQNGLGNLTVSAASVRMFDFAKIRMTGGSGVLTVQATAGELRLANGSFIQNSGTGATSTTAVRTLYVEGGFGGASSIQGGNGGLSVSAESILMNGYSALNNALISAANGTLSVTTTGATPLGMLNMTPNSKIILNAGAGNVNVTVGGNFYRSGGPTITTSGTGTVNIAVAGPVNCSCP